MSAIQGIKQIVITYVFEVPPGVNPAGYAQLVANGITLATPLVQQFKEVQCGVREIAPAPLVVQ